VALWLKQNNQLKFSEKAGQQNLTFFATRNITGELSSTLYPEFRYIYNVLHSQVFKDKKQFNYAK
jgi:hypothetical protein